MPRLLVLTALAFLLALAGFWLLQRDADLPRHTVPSTQETTDSAPRPAVGNTAAAERDATRSPEREQVEPAPDVEPFVVRGLVLADARYPDMSTARVLAYRGDEHDSQGLLSSAMGGMSRRGFEPAFLLQGDAIAETPVAADGTFELLTDQRHLRITLDHDLYLQPMPQIVHVSPSTRTVDVVLSPLLGGMLRGFLPGDRAAQVDVITLTLEPDPISMMRDSRAMLAAMMAATRPAAVPHGDGTFAFRAVAPGARLQLAARGSSVSGRSYEPPLQPGEVRDAVLPLAAAATLAAEIVDENGAPVANASVSVRPTDGGMAAMIRAQHERTDDAGACTFASLDAGDYLVEAMASGRTADRIRTHVPRQEQPTRVRLTLREGGVVTGVVHGPDGNPLAGARVAHHPGGEIPLIGDLASQLGPEYLQGIASQGAKTDEQGRFRLTGLADDGAFLVVGAHDDYSVGIARDVQMGDSDVVVTLQPQTSLTGRVVAADTGRPLPEFTAVLTRTWFLVMQMPVKREVVRDADGAFTLTALSTDSYTLRIEAADYGTLTKSVRVEAAEVLDLGTLELHPAAGIRGVVVDEQGRPVRGALVRKRRGAMADNPMLAMFDGGARRVYSDAQGQFELAPMPPGRVQLLASAQGFASGRSKRLQLVAGQTVDNVVIELGHGGSIRGRIVCGPGQRPDDFLLIAQHQVSQNTHSGDCTADGAFTIDNLDPGAYTVQAMPRELMTGFDGSDWRPGEGLELGKMMRQMTDNVVSQRCTVRSGEQAEVTLEVDDIAIGAQWRVQVEVGGERFASGAVEAVSLDDGTMRIAMLIDGEAVFNSAQPGPHRLQVRSGLTMTPVGDPQDAEFPADTAEHSTTLSLPGGELRGKVVAARTGEPLRSAIVRLHHDGHGERDDPIGLCLTDANGGFAFRGLADGTYSLVAAQPMASADSAASRRAGITVLAGSANQDIVLHAQPAAGASVQVVNSSGTPLAGATVVCVDDDGRPIGGLGLAATGPDGRAFFGGMSTGSARVVGRAPGYAPGASEVLQLAPDQATRFTLALGTGAPCRLSVLDDNGARLRGATISARLADGPWLPAMLLVQQVRPDGTFDLGRLGPGTWQFRVTHPAVGTITHERELRGSAPVTMLVSPDH